MTGIATPVVVPRRMAVVTLCGLAAGMLLLDIHKVSIAIPTIERDLQAGPSGIQLVSAAYVLCFAVVLVPAGQVGDAGLRRTLATAGLAGSLVASLLCTFAPTTAVLVLGRALAGVSAGLLMPQMMGYVQQLFEPHERGRAFGRYGVCVSLVTALGPTLGGATMALPLLGWRGVFAMNVPLVLGLVLVSRHLLAHDTGPGRQAAVAAVRRVDAAGTAWGAAFLVLLLTPVVLTTGRPDDEPARWLLLVPALACLVVFVRHSRRRVAAGRLSVVDPDLLRIASFRNGVLVSLTWFASGPGFNLALVVHLQSARGLSPLEVGLLALPSSVTAVVGAHVGGRLVDRWGRNLSALGMLAAGAGILGTVALVAADAPTSALVVGVPVLQLLSGLGAGLVVSPNHSMTLREVPRGRGSAAGAIGQLGQRMANSVGVATASVAYFAPVYGAGHTLADAPRGAHVTAFLAACAVSLVFLAAALAVVLLDRSRERRRVATTDLTT